MDPMENEFLSTPPDLGEHADNNRGVAGDVRVGSIADIAACPLRAIGAFGARFSDWRRTKGFKG